MEGKQEAVILNQNLDKLIELLRVNNYYCTPLSVNRSKMRRCFFLEKKIYTYIIFSIGVENKMIIYYRYMFVYI